MALTEWTIEVDDRERAGGVVDALAAYPQVVVAVGRLSLGDYLPGASVVVEPGSGWSTRGATGRCSATR